MRQIIEARNLSGTEFFAETLSPDRIMREDSYYLYVRYGAIIRKVPKWRVVSKSNPLPLVLERIRQKLDRIAEYPE